jgi:Tol biopolymer transport system component
VLFTSDTAASSEYYDDARIEAVRPGSGERKVLVENASMARYSPSGHLVFARGGSLFAQPFDPRTLELRGSPALALGGVATDVTTGAAQFALSRSGAALWTPGGSTVSWDIAWVDRQGSETKLQIPPAPYGEVALSPDGTRAALVGGQGGVSDLWVVDLERAAATRLTFGEFVMRPTWSPDGKRLAYSMRPMASRGNRWQLVWKAADGSGPAEVVNEGERSRAPSGFSPDGGTLLYDALNATGTQRDVWMLPLAPRQTPLPLLEGPFVKEEAVVSPDGRFVAYVSDESGQLELYVRPYPSGAGRFQISSGQGTEPRWSRDGRELFYRAAGVLYGVKVDTRQAFSAGKPEPLVERVGMAIRVNTYAPAPDGRRFLTFRAPASAVARASVAFDLGFARRLKAGVAPLH